VSKAPMEWYELHREIFECIQRHRRERGFLARARKSVEETTGQIEGLIRDLVRMGYVDDAYACEIVFERARGCFPTPGTNTRQIFVERVLREILEEDRAREDVERRGAP
jgi:hypothetical protein